MKPPRILTLHPFAGSVAPMAEAFRELWPEAEALNLVDESLFADVRGGAADVPDAGRRLRILLDYAECIGARAVVLTAAAYGPVVERISPTAIPVVRPEQEVARAALAYGRRLAVVCTVATAAPLIANSVLQMAGDEPCDVVPHVVDQAQACLEEGDAERYDRLVADYVSRLRGYDAILLGQVSMSRAQKLAEPSAIPVLSGPALAVRRARVLVADS